MNQKNRTLQLAIVISVFALSAQAFADNKGMDDCVRLLKSQGLTDSELGWAVSAIARQHGKTGVLNCSAGPGEDPAPPPAPPPTIPPPPAPPPPPPPPPLGIGARCTPASNVAIEPVNASMCYLAVTFTPSACTDSWGQSVTPWLAFNLNGAWYSYYSSGDNKAFERVFVSHIAPGGVFSVFIRTTDADGTSYHPAQIPASSGFVDSMTASATVSENFSCGAH